MDDEKWSDISQEPAYAVDQAARENGLIIEEEIDPAFDDYIIEHKPKYDPIPLFGGPDQAPVLVEEQENEWTDIVSTKDGLDTHTIRLPDELEEPNWGVEEDQQRIDQVAETIHQNLQQEDIEGSWEQNSIAPDFQAARKKKKKHKSSSTDDTMAADGSVPTPASTVPAPLSPPVATAPPPVVAVPPPPVAAKPAPPAAPQPPPPVAQPAQPPRPPAPPAAQIPPPHQVQQPTAPGNKGAPAGPTVPGIPRTGETNDNSVKTVTVMTPPKPTVAQIPGTYPAYAGHQDLGGLGQIGIFADSSATSAYHQMNSFVFFLAFVIAYLYTHL